MSFLAPLAVVAGLLSIPIILLYMLRLRRVEMQVSSNFLWQHLVQDREANAPWQRLRFSWLLLLQLLILAALVLALMRPFVTVKTISAGRIVLLLDASASMNATDVDGRRFEQAQEIALDLVGTLSREDSMTVIRVTDVPEVLMASSQVGAELRSVIRNAQPSQTRADWVAAFTLAAAGARGVEELDVVIISDGGLPDNLPEIPGNIRLVPVGNSGENVAISALATREISGKGAQLFAGLANYGDQDAEIIFSINLDETLFSAERYTIPASEQRDVIVDDLPANFKTLTATIQPAAASDVPDYLPTDNQAYAVRGRGGAGRVLLVTQRNIFLSQIFGSLPGSELLQTTPEFGLPAGSYDLYIFDGWLPPVLPDGDLLIINPPTSTPLFSVEGIIEDINQTSATMVLPDDPRTQYLDFSDVNIRAMRQISGYEAWATTLINAAGGALLIAGEVDNRQVAVLSFALQDSDLPLQLAYPILIANLTSWYTPPHAVQAAESISPGSPVTIRALNGDALQITLPNEDTRSLAFGESAEIIFAETQTPGIYRVDLLAGEKLVSQEAFAVNLFDSSESAIAPRASVTVGASTITEAAREETGQRELWEYLALLGLLILLIEWLYYHRARVRQMIARFRQRQPRGVLR